MSEGAIKTGRVGLETRSQAVAMIADRTASH